MKRFKYIFEFVFLFALNGFMLWYFRGYLNFVIAAAMLVFLLYAVLSVHIVKRYLSFSIEVPSEYMKKDMAFTVKLKLENRCILPLVNCRICLRTGNVFIGQAAQNDLVVPVRPRGAVVVEYPLRSAYVGKVEITAEKLVLEDLLFFHSVTAAVSDTKSVYVIPDGNTDEEFSLNAFERGMNEVEESKLKGSDFSDVSQVREYVPGDAMKNIHWKLSAKKDVLMVKERLQMSSRKLLVVLSLEREPEEAADGTIERLYAFGCFMIQNRVPVTLFWWSEKFGEMRQETAESAEEWLQIMIHVFYTRAGSGYVEEKFRSLCPGQGYVLAGKGGIGYGHFQA